MLEKIELEKIVEIAKDAGEVVMEIYKRDFAVEYKDDKSPLTEADLKANELICSTLKKLYPAIPIMSEENKEVEYGIRKGWDYYWCIDPIDGTKEFVKKNDEFTINIALMKKDTPVLGVVYAPAIGKIYSAKKGCGAYLNFQKLPLKLEKKHFTVVASKSHLSDETKAFIEALKQKHPNLEANSRGSSLKLCMVAEGSADIYPRVSPTMEWDTAAADAIVREAGKMTYIYDESISALEYLENQDRLKPVVYNKENLLNSFFIVC
ncbi:MAG: 3'(2'),5'-bisphosphate nucleotidase CysQ [Campylobacterales bacterium]|nr:3'(2'),5'-bisphosphate nucleotidase CysQ [Campylobacterales bacterium]